MAIWKSLKRAWGRFIEDECMTLAASLAYYTLFAMPPLLFLLVTVVSSGMSLAFEESRAQEQAQQFVQQQAANLIGNQAAAAEVASILENTKQQAGTWWKSILSLAGVVIGATGLVAALQSALNRVWRVKPAAGPLARQFILKRLFSLAMILGFGFLLLVSFVVSTILTLLSQYAASTAGLGELAPFWINQVVSFAMTWAFFTFVLRFMPDAIVPWRDAAAGGLLTVIIFTTGRLALFVYLSASNPAEQLGSAAASLVVILLWVYYSSISILFGAEFTSSLSTRAATPEPGAERVEN
ncbi:MAG: YihY/virulence factor BrkB family protein [Pirellulaceae bacterium]